MYIASMTGGTLRMEFQEYQTGYQDPAFFLGYVLTYMVGMSRESQQQPNFFYLKKSPEISGQDVRSNVFFSSRKEE